jgi:hypothetical protein
MLQDQLDKKEEYIKELDADNHYLKELNSVYEAYKEV